MLYTKHFIPGVTPQTEQARSDQVLNAAGGFVFELDPWKRLDRFCILGTEGGTYYTNERTLTRENAKHVVDLIKQDGGRVVQRVAEISDGGLAYKNDPALFVLALAFAEGDVPTKRTAANEFNRIVRTGTHLFTFCEYVDSMRGWGRALKRAVQGWYLSKGPDVLAYQLVKYQQRNGWSHRDVLRLCHAPLNANMARWAVDADLDERFIQRGDVVKKYPPLARQHPLIEAVEQIRRETSPANAARLIRNHNLPREVVPTELLNSPEAWEALAERMPMTAMIRNLATMTRVGLIAPFSDWSKIICSRLSDVSMLKKARIHPIQVLAALTTYAAGHGARGQNMWSPVSQVVDAMDAAFYLSFQNVKPTGKNLMLALDVSSSMNSGEICGVPGLTPRIGTAAMALVTAAAEKNYTITAFSTQFIQLSISPRARLDDVVQGFRGMPFGKTDCSLPMTTAAFKEWPVDAFIIYTDNETWAGRIHPFEALAKYRQKSGRNAKLIVVGMTATATTIADPQDAGVLDVVGFSTDTPAAISDFIRD